jgi:hypothetical protein
VKPNISLRQALSDPKLLGSLLSGDSWCAWRVLLIAAMGEPLRDDERALFKELTGREREPGRRVDELVGVIGRRGGKSRAIATLAAFIGGLCDHRDTLVPGETGVVLCIAPDQRQAAITLDFAVAAFEATPLLRQLIAGRTSDALTLKNGITVEVRAANFRRLRGPTYVAVIADEAAFWQTDESANPDTEILGAVRPGLATTGGPLIMISSPYARRGELWNSYRQHYGPDGDPLILVAQGASRTFNPTLQQSFVDRQLARDHAAASAEYLAQFRSDLEAFVNREAVEACVIPGARERGPIGGIPYRAFVDPAGGSGSDSMTLAIGHREGKIAVLDAVREVRPPFSPEGVVADFSALLKHYRVTKVEGDRYAGEWPREQFRKAGVKYEPAQKPKSELYKDMLPALNSRLLVLLDHPRLVAQIVGLERRTARGGRDSIDHPPGGHDDVCNAVAGLSARLLQVRKYDSTLAWVNGPGDEDAPASTTIMRRNGWDQVRLLEQHMRFSRPIR